MGAPLPEIGDLVPSLVDFRRDIHANPELGFAEHRTASRIAEALRELPEDARRTITFDRGSEFAGYAVLDRELAVKAYFCDPHSPWQKGGVENANGF